MRCEACNGPAAWTAGGSNPVPPRCDRGALPVELAALDYKLGGVTYAAFLIVACRFDSETHFCLAILDRNQVNLFVFRTENCEEIYFTLIWLIPESFSRGSATRYVKPYHAVAETTGFALNFLQFISGVEDEIVPGDTERDGYHIAFPDQFSQDTTLAYRTDTVCVRHDKLYHVDGYPKASMRLSLPILGSRCGPPGI